MSKDPEEVWAPATCTSGKHVPGSMGRRELVNAHSLLTRIARLAFYDILVKNTSFRLVFHRNAFHRNRRNAAL